MSRYSKWAEKEHTEAARIFTLIPAGILFLIVIPYVLLVVSPSVDGRLDLDLISSSPGSWVIGGILLVLGLALAQWAIVTQFTHGRGTPLPMMPTQRLITTGPFRYCRNPMTLGTIVAYLGLAVAAGTIVGFMLVAAFAAVLLIYLKRMEEGELAERFGDEYRAYKRDVPFIIPRMPRKS